MAATRVILVEDEILIRMFLKRQLENLGVEVVGATARGDEVVGLVDELNPDLLIMDIRIEGEKTGIEVALEFAPSRNLPVAFVSAYELSVDELPVGSWVIGSYQKPVSNHALKEILREIGKRSRE